MANLSASNIRFLGIAGLVVVTAGGVVLGVLPLVNQVGGTNEDIDAANQQTTQLQQQITTLRGTAANVSQIDTFRDQFVAKFPETAQVPDLINTIAGAAVAAGIPANNITNYGFQAPQAGSAATGATGTAATGTGAAATSGAAATTPSTTPTTSPATGTAGSTASGGTAAAQTPTTGQAASMTLNLTVSGNPRQFATFLSNLTNMNRNFTVKTFAIAGATNGTAGSTGGSSDTLTLTGQTYLYSHITTPNESAAQSSSAGSSSTSGSATTAPSSAPSASSN